MRTGPSSSAPSTRTGSSSPRRTARWSASSPPGSRSTSPGSATSTSPRAVAAKAVGRALVEAVIENLRARGATHLMLNANLEALPFYERLGFREESRNLVLPLDVRTVGERPLVRLDPRADRRSRRDRARRPPVRAAPPRPLERQHRRAAAQRLDRRLRRRLRPRPVDAAPPGPRALGANRAPSSWRSASSTTRSSASSCSKPAASSTSTSPSRSTTARCRPAT